MAPPDEAIGRLSAAGITRLATGTHVGAGGGPGAETHGLYLRAASAEAAAARVARALEGLLLYVAADEVKPVDS